MFKISVGDHHVFLSGPLYLSGSPLAFFDPGLKEAKTSNDFHPSGLPLASLKTAGHYAVKETSPTA